MAIRDVAKLKKWKPAPSSKRGFSTWHVVNPKQYIVACCDCGLAHEYQYRLRKGYLQMRCRRANGYTRAIRKAHKHVCEKK